MDGFVEAIPLAAEAIALAMFMGFLYYLAPYGPILGILCFLGTLSVKGRIDPATLKLSCAGLMLSLLGCIGCNLNLWPYSSLLLWAFLFGAFINGVAIWFSWRRRFKRNGGPSDIKGEA